MSNFSDEVMEAVRAIEKEYSIEFNREYIKLYKKIVDSCARGVIEGKTEVAIKVESLGLTRDNVTIKKLNCKLIESGIPNFRIELVGYDVYITIDLTSLQSSNHTKKKSE